MVDRASQMAGITLIDDNNKQEVVWLSTITTTIRLINIRSWLILSSTIQSHCVNYKAQLNKMVVVGDDRRGCTSPMPMSFSLSCALFSSFDNLIIFILQYSQLHPTSSVVHFVNKPQTFEDNSFQFFHLYYRPCRTVIPTC